MLARSLVLASALGCAAIGAQAPAFSQQYLQRLGGTVEALGRVVAEFDADAAALGLDRATALAQLATGGTFGARRAATMSATAERHAAMRADLEHLTTTPGWARPLHLALDHDRDLRDQTWDSYRIALPATPGDAIFAAAGFWMGWMLLNQVLWLLARLMRARKTA